MDILRDVAFEVYFKTTEIYKREVRIRKADILLFSENFGYFNIVANEALHLWKEAKAQAVPEGFVLVPREMPKSFDEGLYVYSNNISMVDERSEGFIPMSDINHTEVWKLVIEAQEQSHE